MREVSLYAGQLVSDGFPSDEMAGLAIRQIPYGRGVCWCYGSIITALIILLSGIVVTSSLMSMMTSGGRLTRWRGCRW